jgi:hypothetical protein
MVQRGCVVVAGGEEMRSEACSGHTGSDQKEGGKLSTGRKAGLYMISELPTDLARQNVIEAGG